MNYIQTVTEFAGQRTILSAVVVFLAAFSEAIPVIGAVAPGSAIVIGVSALVGLGNHSIWPILLAAIAGAVASDGLSYWFGHTFKSGVLKHWPLSAHPEMMTRAQRFLDRHGRKSVVLARFTPVVRAFVPLIAGISGMSATRFYVANVLSAIAWATSHVLPSAAAGASLGILGTISGRHQRCMDVVAWSERHGCCTGHHSRRHNRIRPRRQGNDAFATSDGTLSWCESFQLPKWTCHIRGYPLRHSRLDCCSRSDRLLEDRLARVRCDAHRRDCLLADLPGRSLAFGCRRRSLVRGRRNSNIRTCFPASKSYEENGASLSAVAVATLVVVGGLHTSAAFAKAVSTYAPLRRTVAITRSDWLAIGWMRLPAHRIDLGGEIEEPHLIQWGGDLSDLQRALSKQGWNAAIALDIQSAGRYLRSTTTPQGLPALPLLQDGRPPALTLLKEISPDERDILRLWPSSFALSNPALSPIFVGSIAREQLHHPFGLVTIASRTCDLQTDMTSLVRTFPNATVVTRPASPRVGEDAPTRQQSVILAAP